MKEESTKNLQNASNEASAFIFEEASKRLKRASDSKDILDKKGFTIIIILLSILSAIVLFTTNDLSNKNLIISYLILIIGFSISLLLLIKAISPAKYYGDSFAPDEILDNEEYYFKTKENLIYLLINWYDIAIVYNSKMNDKKGLWINISLWIAIPSFLIFILSYILIKFNS